MINELVLDTLKKDIVNEFKQKDYSINSLWTDEYKGELGFIACYHGNKKVPEREISTEVHTLYFNRSNRYGIRLPYKYAKADKHMEKPCRTSNFYEVHYSNITIYEAPPFTFQDLDAHLFKPYVIVDCAYMFEQFIQLDYHKDIRIRSIDIDKKNSRITFVIDAVLEPLTNYFTVVSPHSEPNLEFMFKRIDKFEHHINSSRITCVYELENVRTTIFDTVRSDTQCKADYALKKLIEDKENIRNVFTETISCTAIPDPVNHPNHYEMVGPFESFDIIVESLGIDNARYFCQGNIIKYQTRYREKNGEEDLKKRHWYDRMDQMLAKCETIEDYYKLKESDFK